MKKYHVFFTAKKHSNYDSGYRAAGRYSATQDFKFRDPDEIFKEFFGNKDPFEAFFGDKDPFKAFFGNKDPFEAVLTREGMQQNVIHLLICTRQQMIAVIVTNKRHASTLLVKHFSWYAL